VTHPAAVIAIRTMGQAANMLATLLWLNGTPRSFRKARAAISADTARRLIWPPLGRLRLRALASATASGFVSARLFRPSHLPFATRFRFRAAASLATRPAFSNCAMAPRTWRTRTDTALGSAVRGAFNDYVGGLGQDDLASGNAGATAGLARAQQLWAQQAKLGRVEAAMDKASDQAASSGSGANIDNATRQKLRALKSQPGWTPDEQSAIQSGSVQKTHCFYWRDMRRVATRGKLAGQTKGMQRSFEREVERGDLPSIVPARVVERGGGTELFWAWRGDAPEAG
jgi:hypothetical protein